MDGLLCSRDGTELICGVGGDVTIPSGVISIKGGAFCGCSGLTSVKVPNSVMNIGYGSFSCCSSLTNMVLPFVGSRRGNSGTSDSLFGYVFGQTSCEGTAAIKQRCTSSTYDIPSTYYIPTSLQDVEITDESVIGYGAFYGCSGLTSVKVSEGLTSIGDHAFYQCSGLRSMIIPEGVMSIGNHAFYQCGGLASVTIPSSVVSIGQAAFYRCCGLTSMMIPEGVTSIGWGAFYGCSGLMSVAIPSSVQNVADEAFYGCSTIKSVVVPGWKCNIDFASVTNLVISRGTTSIRDSAFLDCSGLLSVTISDGVRSIGDSAFSGCSGLASVMIPNGVTSIGSLAFSNCSSLTSVRIPNSVASIGSDAFAGCSNIEILDIPSWVNVASTIAGSKDNVIRVTLSSRGGVPASAYYGCSALERVDVASIEDWLSLNFMNAEANPLHVGAALYIGGDEVLKLEIPEGTVEVGDFAFKGGRFVSLSIPEGLMNVRADAFAGCDNLNRVDIPTIEDWLLLKFATEAANPLHGGAALFVGGDEVVELVIPEGATEIADYAFSGGRFSSVVVPNSVTNVSATAFAGCSNVVSLTVPSRIDVATVFADSKDKITRVTLSANGEVPISAYRECSALERVDVASLEEWLSFRFTNADANPLHNGAALYVDGKEVVELVIPDGITELCGYAFSGGQFTSVVIPKSVTNVASTSFLRCANIKCVGFGNWPIMHHKKYLYEPEATGWSNVGGVYRTERQDGNGTQTPVLKLKVEGPKNLSFRWSATYCGNYIRYYLDEVQHSCSCYTFLLDDWQNVELLVPEGIHELKWEYYIPEHFGGYGDYYGWVDLSGWSYRAPAGMSQLFPDSYAKIENVSIRQGVSSIPENAFLGCESLTRVDVQSIVDWLNIDFEDAESNPLHAGAALYVGGEEVSALVIPDGTTEIGECAFRGGRFSSVVIPNSVTNVAMTAFAGCSDIVSVSVPSRVNVAAVFADSKDKIEHLTLLLCDDVPASAYSGCSALERVDVASMEDWLSLHFADAEANPLHAGASLYVGGEELSELAIPDGVAEIGAYAFEGGRFTSVTIPSSVTNVAVTAFAGCSNIVDVTLAGIPSPMVISDWSRQTDGSWRSNAILSKGQTDLKMIVYGPQQIVFKWKLSAKNYYDYLRWSLDGVQRIEGRSGVVDYDWVTVTADIPIGRHEIEWSYSKKYDWNDYDGDDCGWVSISGFECLGTLFPDSYARIRRVAIMSGVTAIPDGYFVGCDCLERVDVSSVEDWLKIDFGNDMSNPLSIGAKLFVDGEEVSALVIPDGVSEIGSHVFKGEQFTSVSIPSSVTNIVQTAFMECLNLSSISLG